MTKSFITSLIALVFISSLLRIILIIDLSYILSKKTRILLYKKKGNLFLFLTGLYVLKNKARVNILTIICIILIQIGLINIIILSLLFILSTVYFNAGQLLKFFDLVVRAYLGITLFYLFINTIYGKFKYERKKKSSKKSNLK